MMAVSTVMRARGQAYWRYVAVLTPAIVLMEGAQGDVVGTDVARLVATLVGAAIAMAVIALIWPFRKIRVPPPDLDPVEASAG